MGFYNEPAPAVPGLHSMPVADWTGAYGTIDVPLVKQIFHQTVQYWGGLLEKIPPIFPPL